MKLDSPAGVVSIAPTGWKTSSNGLCGTSILVLVQRSASTSIRRTPGVCCRVASDRLTRAMLPGLHQTVEPLATSGRRR